MAVNLTELSLPQLEGLKTQLDQVKHFIKNKLNTSVMFIFKINVCLRGISLPV